MEMTGGYSSLSAIVVALSELFNPPERMTVSEAAAKYRKLDNPGSFKGDWDNSVNPCMVEPQDALTSRAYRGVVLVGPAQCGKALPLDTPIATPSGWTTMGALKIGDWVLGSDGCPTCVTFATDTMFGHDCYRVGFDDGTSLVADAEHKWQVDDLSAGATYVLPTEYLASNPTYGTNRRARYAIQNAEALCLPEVDLPIDPYTLGAWLGDGHSYSAWMTLHEDEMEIVDRIRAAGHCVVTEPVAIAKSMTVKIDPATRSTENTFKTKLRALGILAQQGDGGSKKAIPEIYLRASFPQRLELLRGLMDTDGTANRSSGICEITSVLPALADGIEALLLTLGYKVRRVTKKTVCSYKGEKVHGETQRITFVAYAGGEAPFHMSRKLANLRGRGEGRPTHGGRRFITSIERVASVPVRCIRVDAEDHLFLAGKQMVPTHNTDSLILNYVLYSVKVDPMDLIIYSPTNSGARDFSVRRVDRMHRHSPEVGAMLLGTKEADNKFDKRYVNGMMLNLSWPSPAEFAGRPIPRVAITDYDRIDDDIGGEGSAFDLGSKRTTSFRSFGMCVAESSPSRELSDPRWMRKTPHEAPPTTGILALYNRGDRRRWYWPCPGCGSYFEGNFRHLKWNTRLRTAVEKSESVYMECPSINCEYKILPEDRREMQRRGRWVRDGQGIDINGVIHGPEPKTTIASFWVNGVAAAFTTWINLVHNYIVAEEEYDRTGSEEAIKKFYNTDLGEAYTPKSVEAERLPEVLAGRAEDWGGTAQDPVVPEGVRFLVATVDVQKNMFIVQVHGICPGRPHDTCVVDRFSIKLSDGRLDEDNQISWVKPATYLEDWDLITDKVIKRTYPLADGSGRRMMVKMTGCDSGGKAGVTSNAYAYWRKLNKDGLSSRFQLVKGTSTPGAPHVKVEKPDSNDRSNKMAAQGDVPVLMIQSNMVKDMLSGRLDSVVPANGMFRYPTWLEDWFYVELCAERRTDKGWDKLRQRNEAWDLAYYCLGICMSPAVKVDGINWAEPPLWAADWDKNNLIMAANAPERFALPPKVSYDFGQLGAALA